MTVDLQWRCAYLIVAMFETPTPPSERGPSQEWMMTYVKSICGMLKIAEVVNNVSLQL